MAEQKPKAGNITWVDLTVPDADRIRDFYAEVVGWRVSPVDMGGYDDYCMIPRDSEAPVAGVCHAQGANDGLPAQWLVYITVDNLDESLKRCQELGGKLIHGPRGMGGPQRFAVIEDPSGAVAALFQAG
jgi:hypothetical protein